MNLGTSSIYPNGYFMIASKRTAWSFYYPPVDLTSMCLLLLVLLPTTRMVTCLSAVRCLRKIHLRVYFLCPIISYYLLLFKAIVTIQQLFIVLILSHSYLPDSMLSSQRTRLCSLFQAFLISVTVQVPNKHQVMLLIDW